jgi:AcrR family transcriptional regulator
MPESLAALDETTPEPLTVAERRRVQIVKTAIRLFSKSGYFQTTTEDIANAIPVSKGLVYKYFKDKDDLLYYCMQYVLEKYKLDDVPQWISEFGPLAALMKIIKIQCALAKEHAPEVVLAYRSTADLSPDLARQIKLLESKIARMIRQCLDACIHKGYIKPTNTDIMAYQFIMYAHTWALKNWAFRDRYSAEEYAAEGQNILLIPFLTSAGEAEYENCKRQSDGCLVTTRIRPRQSSTEQ